jgi:alkanesulfonate monooxygenase SsuD/methylene tetrahydromethanopterin reductase-like flavin-dependent oxidoreductase (luciferase family)
MKVQLLLLPKIRATEEELAELRPIGRNPDRFGTMLKECEDLAILADELGVDAFGSVEHHFHTEGREVMPSPLIFYAKLAQLTKNLIFMPTSLIIPTRDPLRTAEDVALFDSMFPGRLKFSVARGYQKRWVQTLMQDEAAYSSFRPEEKAANDRNREIYNEHVDIMLAAWTEDAFSYDGKHYQVPFPYEGIGNWDGWELTRDYGAPGEIDGDGVLKKIGVVPAPLSKPHPEIFVPFAGSPPTLLDCARRGFGMIMLESDPERFLGFCRQYQEAMKENGHTVGLGEKISASRAIAIGDTFEEAMDIAARTVGYDYATYFAKFGFAEGYRNDDDDPNEFVDFKSGREAAERMYDGGHVLVGTPDDITEQLSGLQRCYADGDLEWLSWEYYAQGNLSAEESERQLRMFAEHVLPNFRS